jgi:L-2-hydroxyglutarate oxidase LhgO
VAEPRTYDVSIIGGGILGLATGVALLELRPGTSLLLLEKEERLASHQTGHNSGVIHAGIYYKPGSEKARLCVDGVRRMKAFCELHEIPVEECGKLVVATDVAELGHLDELQRRGEANGVPGLRRIDAEEAREIEPHARAIAALHSPQTSIVDFARVARAMAADLRSSGATICTGTHVDGTSRDGNTLILGASGVEFRTRSIINCGGLQADLVARALGARPRVRIVPFRGEYFGLARPSLVRGLIYPVPDPQFPFLGVHFTRRIDGSVEAGPNAVLAFAREGYRRSDISASDVADLLSFRGFWCMAGKYWRTGLYESYRSLSKKSFVRALQRLVPELSADDLSPGGSGVRAQAVMADGTLVDDFNVEESRDAIHVLNAPSPAATASLSIGRHVATLAIDHLPAFR